MAMHAVLHRRRMALAAERALEAAALAHRMVAPQLPRAPGRAAAAAGAGAAAGAAAAGAAVGASGGFARFALVGAALAATFAQGAIGAPLRAEGRDGWSEHAAFRGMTFRPASLLVAGLWEEGAE